MSEAYDFASLGCLVSYGGLLLCSVLLVAAFLERSLFVLFAPRRCRYEGTVLGLYGCFSWVGSAAPLFGILGTVFGIMLAFGAEVDIESGKAEVVLAGIAIALFTTAIGLVEALVSLTGRALFRRATQSALDRMENRA